MITDPWHYLRSRGASLLAGVFVLGFLAFLTDLAATRVRRDFREHRFSTFLLSREGARLQRLEDRALTGDADASRAALALRRSLSRRTAASILSPRGTLIDMLVERLLVGLLTLVRLTVAIVGFLYVLLLMLFREEPGAILRRINHLFFPTAKLLAGFVGISFLWLPIAALALMRGFGLFTGIAGAAATGLVFAGCCAFVALAPRFALSPVLLMLEGKGVVASLRESFHRTAGSWQRLLWSVIGALMFFLLLQWALAHGMRSLFPSPSSPFLQLLQSLLAQGALALFVAALARESLAVIGVQPLRAADARTMAANSAGLSDAPPTSPPSIFGWRSNSPALSAFIDPP